MMTEEEQVKYEVLLALYKITRRFLNTGIDMRKHWEFTTEATEDLYACFENTALFIEPDEELIKSVDKIN